VNWRAYGLQQSKDSLPMGPYVFAVSVVSPFIKFKNASKETIDASEELVEEIRRALMQAGQKLSRHIRRENKEADLERKIAHIEQFGPILVDGLVRISGAKESRKVKAQEGLKKLLGRDAKAAQKDLSEAEVKLQALKERQEKAGLFFTTSSKNDVAVDSEEEVPDKNDDSDGEAGAPAARGTGKTTTAKVIETKGVVATTGKGTEKSAGTAKGTEKSAGTAKSATTEKTAEKTTAKTTATTAKATTDKSARK
jgi:DNA topoisomerase-6 subunit B